jgi:hypothetical protein
LLRDNTSEELILAELLRLRGSLGIKSAAPRKSLSATAGEDALDTKRSHPTSRHHRAQAYD